MKVFFILFSLMLMGCQSVQEKDALILKQRVEDLKLLSHWKGLRCEVHSQLSAPQTVKYRKAFPDEAALIDNWDVSYDWTSHSSKCSVHAKPLTPMTANQRAFVDEALCMLLQVFWVHSPFDYLHVLPEDVIDQDNRIFLRQKPDSDVGIYLDKTDLRLETKTVKNGTLYAWYEFSSGLWRPKELRQETPTFQFVMKDFAWNDSADHEPPRSFWIYVGEQKAPEAHTHLELGTCQED